MKDQPANKIQPMPAKRTSLFAAREEARAKLKAAGVLASDLVFPADLTPIAEEELEQLGAIRPGARPSETIIAEDRGH